ncbi:hypothetical protein RD792_003714 [Penstemon davidsonii]|uniref:EGF-like domain-containing protein n=1 Tax=Penstemon davidsonii TaxID=160366 RepID=A0ABR0DG90_9LAMI|nr:hypothetical protein RD792_003714 [Penstemon davidsonii]
MQESGLSGCQCPPGFRGDGHTCEDVDECKERLACNCDGCSCKNTWGGFNCSCQGDKLYLMELDTCIVIHGHGDHGYHVAVYATRQPSESDISRTSRRRASKTKFIRLRLSKIRS